MHHLSFFFFVYKVLINCCHLFCGLAGATKVGNMFNMLSLFEFVVQFTFWGCELCLHLLPYVCVLARAREGLIHGWILGFRLMPLWMHLGLCIPNISSKHIMICHLANTLKFIKELFVMARFNTRWTTGRFMCLSSWMQMTLNANKACSSWLGNKM